MTSHEIAFWLQIRPSTHLNKILLQMVDMGLITFIEKPHRKSINKRVFSATGKGRYLAALFVERQDDYEISL
jgi:hypothetical protein